MSTLSNQDRPTEVSGKAWQPLLWTSQPILVIPHALLCVDGQNEQRRGRWMRWLLEAPTKLRIFTWKSYHVNTLAENKPFSSL